MDVASHGNIPMAIIKLYISASIYIILARDVIYIQTHRLLGIPNVIRSSFQGCLNFMHS